MKNIFLLLKNDSTLPMIQVYLNGHKEFKVFVQSDISIFETDISFLEDIILITDNDFFSSIKSKSYSNIKAKYVLTTEASDPTSNTKYFSIDKWEELCQDIITTYSSGEQFEYAEIPFFLLKNVTTTNCDIFIEILKNNSPHQIKLFNKNDPIDQTTVERYLDKGLRVSKILASEKQQFLNSISNQHYLNIQGTSNPNIVGKALDTSLLLLKEVGFNSTSTQLIEGVVESINSQLNTSNKKINEIKNLLDSKSSRYYKKAHLISLLGSKILASLDWATHRHQDLLTFNSLMCDICLEKEEMLYIVSNKDFKDSRLSEEDKEKIWTHARDAFHLLQSYKDRPLESDLMILEHHGNKNGVGFSEEISPQLNKVSIIFRICEDFAVELLKLKDLNQEVKLLDILQHLYLKHDKKSLHLYINELKRCFID